MFSQPSRDSEEERCTESTLTTLFPGQKKRVSHFAAKGNVSTRLSYLYCHKVNLNHKVSPVL